MFSVDRMFCVHPFQETADAEVKVQAGFGLSVQLGLHADGVHGVAAGIAGSVFESVALIDAVGFAGIGLVYFDADTSSFAAVAVVDAVDAVAAVDAVSVAQLHTNSVMPAASYPVLASAVLASVVLASSAPVFAFPAFVVPTFAVAFLAFVFSFPHVDLLVAAFVVSAVAAVAAVAAVVSAV
ncbi:hypothetical protein F4703DRAFT_1859298 [Phycomyces blakesleeanus]